MALDYDGWARRIDLNFRSKYPYLNTKIFKLDRYKYQILVLEKIDTFDEVSRVFDREIRYVTAPVVLTNVEPVEYQVELPVITDDQIPSKFEGLPFTAFQIYNHISSIHPGIQVSNLSENHERRIINVEVAGELNEIELSRVQDTVDSLKSPYAYHIKDRGTQKLSLTPQNDVFCILSSHHLEKFNCQFLERDEKLWFDNVESIYNGSFSKKDLYFFEPKKTSCLVNFSKFQNANLRNHLLLYDIVYCVLPLAQDMNSFLESQRISKEDILHLLETGRVKILNMQPEYRLDFGFLNEAFQTNPTSVISRRALSALCAIDLVDINNSYVFCDPELHRYIYPLVKEVAQLLQQDEDLVSKFLLWPKQALRSSLYMLNESGPMGISNYGVNKPLIQILPDRDKDKIEFEFIVNSDQIHLAHALDATYFPFFIDGKKYSDHPYAMMMGNLLNFFKKMNILNFNIANQANRFQFLNNPSINLISIFDINDYIPVSEFEDEISSSVIRKGMNSLFSELSALDYKERNERISSYNAEVTKALGKKHVTKNALDLGEDAIGLIAPFLATGKKLIKSGTKKAMDKYPTIKIISEYIEDKSMSSDKINRNVSVLSQINRVARLKKLYK